MKGQGRGVAAVSFLNALFTGTGSAAGVELAAHAEVELAPGSPPAAPTGPLASLPLVDATAAAALRAWAVGPWTARLSIRSEVPPSCGLKSSSAVASAVENAVLRALGRTVPPEEVARVGATVARDGGYSATGAFDDALASVVPGIHVTNNTTMTPLRSWPAPEDLEVVLWVPARTHRPSPELRPRFRERRAEAQPAVDAALGGEWARAMDLNSALVESVMGYAYEGLRTTMAGAGAIASGVSGMGPAFAVIAPSDRLGSVLRALPAGTGQVIVTRFTRQAAGVRP